MNKLFLKIDHLLHKPSTSGIVLMIVTLLSLIIANSPWHHAFEDLMHRHFILGFENLNINKSLHHWVNDGLMAIFFLLVGLEVKTELKFGKLNSFNSAIFPVVVALCGAIFPALIFYFINVGDVNAKGWAIPMATDIAFVIGILALVGSKLPTWVKVFVTTVAVVDDLIAVLVIAFFYTDTLNWFALEIAFGFLVILLILNYYHVNQILPYLFFGFFLWAAVLASGIHSTIAGVILAMTLPLHKGWKMEKIERVTSAMLHKFEKATDANEEMTRAQAHVFVEGIMRNMESPCKRLERRLHIFVYFVIMPLFAFVNSGIPLSTEAMTIAFSSNVTWGVILGLSLGKLIGILFAVWLMLTFVTKTIEKTKETWSIFLGVAFLCGIGFTMSLFIANLSYTDTATLEASKLGILAASLVNGVIGYVILKRTVIKTKKSTQ